jgi:sarcosine oxidase gamma subunit
MTAAKDRAAESFSLKRISTRHAIELVALRLPHAHPLCPDWPTLPGQIYRESDGSSLVLHFAPGRWLCPSLSPRAQAFVELSRQQGVWAVMDISGKWEAFHAEGPGARQLLGATTDIEAVLQGRGCGALPLFDCPAIVARDGHGYSIWLSRSYCAAFQAALESFREGLDRRLGSPANALQRYVLMNTDLH